MGEDGRLTKDQEGKDCRLRTAAKQTQMDTAQPPGSHSVLFAKKMNRKARASQEGLVPQDQGSGFTVKAWRILRDSKEEGQRKFKRVLSITAFLPDLRARPTFHLTLPKEVLSTT